MSGLLFNPLGRDRVGLQVSLQSLNGHVQHENFLVNLGQSLTEGILKAGVCLSCGRIRLKGVSVSEHYLRIPLNVHRTLQSVLTIKSQHSRGYCRQLTVEDKRGGGAKEGGRRPLSCDLIVLVIMSS